jgi:hypothetical protein
MLVNDAFKMLHVDYPLITKQQHKRPHTKSHKTYNPTSLSLYYSKIVFMSLLFHRKK